MTAGPLPRTTQVWAAVLRAGPGAAASHVTAAELDGLCARKDERIHVTAPVSRRVRGELHGMVVHYAHRLAESRHPSKNPPRTRVDDTVLDLVDISDRARDAEGWVTNEAETPDGRRCARDSRATRAPCERRRGQPRGGRRRLDASVRIRGNIRLAVRSGGRGGSRTARPRLDRLPTVVWPRLPADHVDFACVDSVAKVVMITGRRCSSTWPMRAVSTPNLYIVFSIAALLSLL